jgi:hypothetical protein
MHRLGEAFEIDGPALLVCHALELPGQVGYCVTGQDLPGSGQATQPCRQIKSRTSIASFNRNRFAGVQPDTDREWQRGIEPTLLSTPPLESHGGAERIAGGGENSQSFVTTELNDLTAMRSRDVSGNLGKYTSQPRSSVVAMIDGETRVAPDIGNEERQERGGRERSCALSCMKTIRHVGRRLLIACIKSRPRAWRGQWRKQLTMSGLPAPEVKFMDEVHMQ